MTSWLNNRLRRDIPLTKCVLLCACSTILSMNAAQSESSSKTSAPRCLAQVTPNTAELKTQNKEKQEYLRQLKSSNSTLNNSLQVTVMRVSGYKTVAGKDEPVEQIRAADQSGAFHLNLGDRFRLQIKNNSAKSPLFLYLFMLGSSGSISAINNQAEHLNPGESMKTSVLRISPPLGSETIKIIATTKAADFSSLTTGRAIVDTTKNPIEGATATGHADSAAAIGDKVELFDPKSADWATQKIDYVIESASSGRDGKPLNPKLSDAELKFINGTSEVELFSLNVGPEDKHAERIEGYQFKSKKVITAKADKQELIDALQTGILEGTDIARCFNPRHALRFKGATETHDFIICFECRQVKEYIKANEDIESSAEPAFFVTADRFQPVFDKLLKVQGK